MTAEPGRVTLRHQDGRPTKLTEISFATCFTTKGTTVRVSDSPGSERWIDVNKESIAQLGAWC